MLFSNHNARFLFDDLNTVLTAFYNAEELRTIIDDLIFPFVEKAPLERKLRKAEMIEILEPLLVDPKQFYTLFQSFPEPLQKVLTFLAWEGDCALDPLEAAVGFAIATRHTGKALYQYQRNTLEVKRSRAFCFVAIEVRTTPYAHTGDPVVIARLPNVLRCLLCQALPNKPNGYDIEAVPDAAIQADRRFSCQQNITSDLQRTADFIDKKHLQLKQSGQPSKASLRQANRFLGDKEFFPPSKEHPKLEHIRTHLFISLIRALPKEFREDLAHGRIGPAQLRRLMDFVEDHPQWVFDELLPHLFTRDFRINPSTDTWLSFQEFIRNLPLGEWVTWQNIARHHRFHNLDFCFCYNSGVGARVDNVIEGSRFYYHDIVPLKRDNAKELVDLPLIRGFAFLLATLGFAEIAYTQPPAHKGEWKPRGLPYLTPFDGLHALRITPEGAYAFGFDQDIQLAAPDDARSRITLNPNCLNAICHDIDPVTELSLLQFMEKISPGHYRMTRNSFLRGCTTQKDAANRLIAFQQSVGDPLPPLWESFFNDTLSTCMALKQVQGYRVFQLANDPALRQLFASDPALRSHCIRAEGMKVLIPHKDLNTVQKHLKTLGYLLQ